MCSYEHYLGQVRLYRPDEIKNTQTFAAFDQFLGRAPEDPLRPRAAFLQDPDQRVERFGITVDAHLENHDFRNRRHGTAKDLEELRQRILGKVTYEQQVSIEQETQRNEFIETYLRFCGPLSGEKREQLKSLHGER